MLVYAKTVVAITQNAAAPSKDHQNHGLGFQLDARTNTNRICTFYFYSNRVIVGIMIIICNLCLPRHDCPLCVA